MSRTKNAIRNTGFGILSRVMNLLLGFATRTVFIYHLGSTYLGVNGLYSDILNLLSFAELGFGSAMTFAMYKPVAEEYTEKVLRLLKFYRKIYTIVAALIAGIGIILVPFLPSILKGADWLSSHDLRIYFLIYLFDTVASYFVTYKYSYLNALQKNYIHTNIDTIVTTIARIAQIITIMATEDFLKYLVVNSVILLVSKVCISKYLDKKYPILATKTTSDLAPEEKHSIYQEVRGLIVHQFASVTVQSTDSILIASLTSAGVLAVGYVSNYNLLMHAVLAFAIIMFSSVTSGFGNMAAVSSPDSFHNVFKRINYLNFWVYGFCSIAFWILIPPFIGLWIGPDKLIDDASFTLITIHCYLYGQSMIYNNARIAKGNFSKDKKWALIQAIVNLVVSYIGAKLWGLVGIYIGTIVSRLVYVIFRPYSTYRFLFDVSAKEYYKQMVFYFGCVVLAALATKGLSSLAVNPDPVIRFFIKAAIVAVVPNVVFFVCTRKTQQFEEWKEFFLGFLKRRSSKNG